ncbi:MAG TPA: hypothetical protein DEG17_09345 [Cyanobacteria bacterium UBA11149]|nr:hypothetical protein [Cyanobacteria bacterium UBA11367]HBE57486.1 hypothetical protein [Cyanobacteria bacterium UBA11366]HBR73580.1 hypothetical protein [Cyanobacteria bacterium UBA11159]HBS71147.1 hypothetical protein [Cyanobacteria bacterium UBA11153]HBW89054.1 hypothetical protein [Cyanobacteria bacterium UBA11149]HCA96710.1 hypothetical protein [Cyanobacteria bacterium UBA9226]
MKSDGFAKLLEFLQKLEQQEINYTLAHHRDEAMMVTVAVPGERWEVEFFSDGSVELEKFISNGEISGENELSGLFSRFAEAESLVIAG